MTVYYLRRKIDGAIKIGFTDRDPLVRLREIANSSGLEIELLAATEGTRADERAAHEAFGALRISGEWFQPGKDLLAHIELIAWQASPAGRRAAYEGRISTVVAGVLRRRVLLSSPNGDFFGPWDDEFSAIANECARALTEGMDF